MSFWFSGSLYAQVNAEELGKGRQVQGFTSNTGPAAWSETRDEIRGIGYHLGTAVKSGVLRSGAENRYFVIHSKSVLEGNKLDADIFGLGSGVGVDHIRNLRIILQGYLEGAYNYSTQDASFLAEYITIYNAAFRGNWGYFNTIYKRGVLQYLTPEKVGLSFHFTEWPGKTLMVIPLGNSTAGSLSVIDTSPLSDPVVVIGTDQRTAMADFKDREADDAEETARRQREAIAAKKARIAAERAALAAEQERLGRERDPMNAEELAARKAEAAQWARELAEREAALEREWEAAQQAEDFANRKRTEAEQDRKDLLERLIYSRTKKVWMY